MLLGREGRKKRGGGHTGFTCTCNIFLYTLIYKIYVKYISHIGKTIFYRSLPVDQTFLALMKMIRCVPVGMARLLAISKLGKVGYLGVFKISGLPILILCRSLSPYVHFQVQILDMKLLLCTLSVTLLFSI